MIHDVIQLLGIANPQLSKSWTLTGSTTATTIPLLSADGFTLACGAGDEWIAPCAGILTEDQHHTLLQLPGGTFPGTGIVLQLSPQVYLALCRLYATVVEGKAANTHLPDRPVPRYFLFSSVTKLVWMDNGESKTGPSPGIFLAGDPLHIHGNLTIHDEEGIVIDPVAVAAAFNLFLQTHWSLENKSISTGTPAGSSAPPFTQPGGRQLNHLAVTGGNQKRIFFTSINNSLFAPAINPFGNVTGVPGASSVFTIIDAAAPVTKNAGTDDLLQLALSTNGLFGQTLNYPSSAAATLPRDFIRVKVADWNTFLLGDIPAGEPTRANNVLPIVRENELIRFCFTGNACLGEINSIFSGGSTEQMLASTVVDSDFTLPPLPDGTGNHSWPAFSQGLVTSAAAVPSSLKDTLAKTAHFIAETETNNTDVYLEIRSAGLQNGWAVRVFHRVFHPDGRETRGDGAGTIVFNNTAAFRLKDPLGLNRPFSTVTLPADAVLMVDMVVINAASPVQSRRFGNLVTNIQPATALTAAEQNNLLPGSNTLPAVANLGIAPGGFLGVRTSPAPISAITNITSYLLASGTFTQPREAPVLPTQSRLDGLAAAKNAPGWSAFAGGLQIRKISRENLLMLGNPGSPGGTDTHTTGIVTSDGRLAYDLARQTLRRARNLSERMSRLVNNTDYVLPALPAATARTFIGAVLQTIAKKTESPRLAEFQQTMSNLPVNAAALSSDIQQLLTNDTKPAWLPDAIKDRFRTAMTGTPAGANHQLALEELRREYSSSLEGRRDSYFSIRKAFENATQFIYIESAFFGPTHYPATPGGTPPADDLVEILLQQLIAKPGLKLILCLAQEIPFNRGYENIARFHKKNRHDAALRLLGTLNTTTHRYQRHTQVVAYHPLAFPGRPVKINTQCIIVDDVYALVGSSSISQRGMFFDGSTDVVFSDKQLKNGKCASVTSLRKQLMLQYLRSDNALPGLPASNQVFLQNGRSAFEMLRTLLDGGGGGMIKEFVPETLAGIGAAELAALENLADPNGNSFFQSQALLNTWLAALSTVPE